MNNSHSDDKMELATSPYHHQDDIDFDLDPMHDPSIDNSMVDETEVMQNNADLMQADTDGNFQDDQMLYEDVATHDEEPVQDFSMDTIDHNETFEGDEIFDEEEELHSTTMIDRSADTETMIETSVVEEEVQMEENKPEEGDVTYVENGLEETEHDLSYTNIPDRNDEHSLTENENPEEYTNVVQAISETADGNQRDMTKDETVENTEYEPIYAAGTNSLEGADDEDTLGLGQTNIITKTFDDNRDQVNVEDGALYSQESQSVELSKESEGQQQREQTLSVEQPLTTDDSLAQDSEMPFHPVKIVYLDQEMSLFPPLEADNSTTFFLADSNLAYEPLERLLVACREILGDSLEHNDELVLDIAALGLHICEDSKYVSGLTLSQVVDVYLSLSQNEGIVSINPLICDLSSRVCLASQYTYLSNAVKQGKTYSEIVAEHAESADGQSDAFAQDNEKHETLESAYTGENNDLPTHPEIHQDEQSHIDQQDENIHNGLEVEDAESAPVISETADIERPHADRESPHTAELEVEKTVQDVSPVPEQEEQEDKHTVEVPSNFNESSSVVHIASSNRGNGTEEANSHNNHESDGTNNTDFVDDGESTSSHTVQAEPSGQDQSDIIDESLSNNIEANQPLEEIQEDDPDQTSAEAVVEAYEVEEDLFQEENAENEDDEEVDELYDDDIADMQPSVLESPAQASSVAKQTTATDQDPAKTEISEESLQDTHENIQQKYGQDDISDSLNPEDLEEENVPTTPPRQASTKRKALEEEDDLALFDIDTPEPKRTRPS